MKNIITSPVAIKIMDGKKFFDGKRILFALVDQTDLRTSHTPLYEVIKKITLNRTQRIRLSTMHNKTDVEYFDSIDLAMTYANEQEYDLIFIQNIGNLIRRNILIEHISNYVNTNPNFFMMAFTLDWDAEKGEGWIECHHQMMVINIHTWRSIGSPIYGGWEKVTEQLPSYARSGGNFHDKYTPYWVQGLGNLTTLKTRSRQGWGFMKAALLNSIKIDNFSNTMRDCRWYVYPETDSELLYKAILSKDNYSLTNPNQRKWINTLMIPPSIWIYNSENYKFFYPLTASGDGPRDVYFGTASGFKYLDALRFADDVKFIIYDYNQTSIDWISKLRDSWDGNDYPAYLRSQPQEIQDLYIHINSSIEENQEILFDQLGGEETFKILWNRFKNADVTFVVCNIFDTYELNNLLSLTYSNNVFFYYSNIFATDHTPALFPLDNVDNKYDTFLKNIFTKFPDALTYGTTPIGEWKFSKDPKTNNESFILIDADLNYSYINVERAHTEKLNRWKGWECSAGLQSLYIDFDGNVFRGTCLEGGWLGNINVTSGLHEGFKQVRQNQWVTCTKEICSCGADMSSPKVKNKENIVKFFKDLRVPTQIKINKQIDAPSNNAEIVFEQGFHRTKTIIWDFGRRCNFDFWYCSDNSHNNFETLVNLDMFMNSYNRLKTAWIGSDRTKLSFTGGEPAVYKDYLPFVKKIREDGHIISTTTNGSGSKEYYAELAIYSNITFSIHLEYVKKFGLEKFTNAISGAVEAVRDARVNNVEGKESWLGVRIMCDPGNQPLAEECLDTFKKTFANNLAFSVQGIHAVDSKRELLTYNQKEITWIAKANAG